MPGRAAQWDHVGKGLSLGRASDGTAGGSVRRDAVPGAPRRSGNYGYPIVTAAFGGGRRAQRLIPIYGNRLPRRLADAQGAMRDGNAGNDKVTRNNCRAALAGTVSDIDAVFQTPR
jgi:hypothetical protein